MFTGTTKAWHIHKKQIDWWYVASGTLRVALHDTREDSPTKGETMELLMGDHETPKIMKVPPGVAHGCKVIQGPSVLFTLHPASTTQMMNCVSRTMIQVLATIGYAKHLLIKLQRKNYVRSIRP